MKQIILIILIALGAIGLGVVLFVQDQKKGPVKKESIVASLGNWL